MKDAYTQSVFIKCLPITFLGSDISREHETQCPFSYGAYILGGERVEINK